MKEELLKLAERVEALSGPDREVEARIWCALNGKKYVGHWREYDGPNTRVEYIEPPKRTPLASSTVALRWTASLDAAMTLVPKGWAWSVLDRRTTGYSKPNGQCWTKEDRSTLHGDAATPALALCAAALRALAKEK